MQHLRGNGNNPAAVQRRPGGLSGIALPLGANKTKYGRAQPMEAAMPGHAVRNEVDKHKRYRSNQKGKGRRLLRIWVPDTRTPEFQAEARRQALLLRDAPDEEEVMAFIEAVSDYGEE